MIEVKRGMRIVFKPEWRDKGDENFTFIAVEDAHPIDGGFGVSTIENTLWIRPIQTGARVHMVESAEPFLPVATFTFRGLSKKGAIVQLRRMIGDRELSITEETIGRAEFHRVFCRRAADCKIGQDLRICVEFPKEPV